MLTLGQWSFVVQLEAPTTEREEDSHSDSVRLETHMEGESISFKRNRAKLGTESQIT